MLWFENLITNIFYLQEVTDELKNYESTVQALHEQAANLGEEVQYTYFSLF